MDRLYRSSLRNWDEQATVRIKPRRILQDEETLGKLYFSPEDVPISQHPRIIIMGREISRELEIQRLYSYLDFTDKLEHQVVNTVVRRIAQRQAGIDLPDEMVWDAYKIYCDEAYHAVCAVDLARQVEQVSGVVRRVTGKHGFIMRLREIRSTLPRDLWPTMGLLAVVISETTISSILARLPADERVVSAVRKVVGDHAVDEGRHHAYFSAVFQVVWPLLPYRHRQMMGPLLPGIILAFLAPDYDDIELALASCRVPPTEIPPLLEDTYSPEIVLKSARRASHATIHLFEENGVFEDQGTRESFQASGLVPA